MISMPWRSREALRGLPAWQHSKNSSKRGDPFLGLADEPGSRRQTKAQANLQEGRRALAWKIFHGRSGQLYQRYQDGMEDQLGALRPVLNPARLFTTTHTTAAGDQ